MKVLCPALLVAVVACSRAPEPGGVTEPRTAVVESMLLTPRTFTERITTFGVFEATSEIELAVDFSAQVTAVHFDDGMRVEAGRLLVEFDASERQLRKQRAESGKSAAAAELEEANAVLARTRRLVARGVESDSALESAELAARSAKARFEDAVAAVALAQRELERVRVLSPVDGVVGVRSVDAGETPPAGAVLATIETTDTVRVVTYVGQKDVNHLRVGSPALVTTPAVRGLGLEARIESVGIKADPRTGNFVVRVALPNADGMLRPGMTARVELTGMTLADALLVPDRAIVDRDRRRVVFKVVADKAVRVEPLLLPSTGDLVPVLEGLAPGDRVITGGLQSVVDGTTIRLAAESK